LVGGIVLGISAFLAVVGVTDGLFPKKGGLTGPSIKAASYCRSY
jgi:hypothetical protein